MTSSVLVIGTGYIGYNVALAFVNAGYKVYGLVRKENTQRLNDLVKNEITPIVGNAQDVDLWLPIALKVDIIVESIGDSRDYTTPFKILEALKKVVVENKDVSILYTSGLLVYGDANGQVFDEKSPRVSHVFMDWRIKIEDEYKTLGALIIQPSILYGLTHSLVRYFFEVATQGGVIDIYGDANQVQSWIHVVDLARLYVLLAGKAKSLRGQSFIASSYNENVSDIVREIAHVSNTKIDQINYLKPTENPFTECFGYTQKPSIAKITSLGYTPIKPSLLQDAKIYYDSWKASEGSLDGAYKYIRTVIPRSE
ncbi:hypothetical protein CYY_003055 [Polysphondylium violaceum]|uniref:NAD-dependent epimerase/dehydratase domain-containing protein n=1 Tax=Polysphondylium violaceum TaxID=133409 RepID=A0A8J4V6A3_9MYCE|nr:hypothetical protein CYY_003055 [Polysphondylium violaceum]